MVARQKPRTLATVSHSMRPTAARGESRPTCDVCAVDDHAQCTRVGCFCGCDVPSYGVAARSDAPAGGTTKTREPKERGHR